MTEIKRRRPGGGRKPKDKELGAKKQASWWLANDVLEIIRAQPNQAEFIEQAVREKAYLQL
jgi:hypothetical protein